MCFVLSASIATGVQNHSTEKKFLSSKLGFINKFEYHIWNKVVTSNRFISVSIINYLFDLKDFGNSLEMFWSLVIQVGKVIEILVC